MAQQTTNKRKATHKTPSGLGGSFNVVIISEPREDGRVRVRVTQPGWNKYEFWQHPDHLTPLG